MMAAASSLLAFLRTNMRVKLEHTHGHQGQPWNELADTLADWRVHNPGPPHWHIPAMIRGRCLAWLFLVNFSMYINQQYPHVFGGKLGVSHLNLESVVGRACTKIRNCLDEEHGGSTVSDYTPANTNVMTYNCRTIRGRADAFEFYFRKMLWPSLGCRRRGASKPGRQSRVPTAE